MPLELQIIRACEFIRAGARGQPNMEASRAVLRELAAACRRRGIDRALLDLRELRPGAIRLFPPGELAMLVNTFREIRFAYEQRLAVLYSEDPYHGARMFAFIGALRGWRVRAFPEFEAALKWLGGRRRHFRRTAIAGKSSSSSIAHYHAENRPRMKCESSPPGNTT